MGRYAPVVGVTGMNATDNPGPGLPVATAIRRDPEFEGQIVGLAYDALDPGLYQPGLVDSAWLVPYPSAGRQALWDRLAEIRDATGLDVLVPNLDAELPLLVGEEATLARLGIRAFLPTRAQLEARSKARLAELCAEHDLPTPPTEVLNDPAPLYTLHTRMRWPVVVKSPLYGAKVCHTVDQAVEAFHAQAAKWGLPIIVQEHVVGEEGCVACLGDGAGGLLGAVAMKKLLITDAGKGWVGVSFRDERLLDLTARVIAATGWRGPCEVEALRDRDGTWHLLEINPRFPAWVDLTAGCGQNLPAMCVRKALGEDVPKAPPYEAGIAFVRISAHQIVPIHQIAALTALGTTWTPSEVAS